MGLALALCIGAREILNRGGDLVRLEAPAAAGQPIWAPLLIWLAVVAALFLFTRRPAAFTPGAPWVRTTLRRLGMATYPLYLVHDIVGALTIRRLVEAGVAPWLALSLALALVVGLSFVVALLVEPAVRRGLRFALERAARAVSKAGVRRLDRSGPT
ncbi:hypothetical protein [Phenylobacterium sp.]|uniref:hypothetical protein n=1 Tax=Phenylobacterium sp. TaxID=1871053 RepID=UPI0035B15E1F